MSRAQRFGLLGVAAIVLVAGLIVAIASSGGSSTQGITSPQTIVVKNARPIGGVKVLTFKQGQTIDLPIDSDTADEVHFHGYDVHKDVAGGGSVRFRLPATIEGIFIVELENHKQTLASVKVEP